MNIPSKHIEDAVNALSSLPGIGKKTALRLSLHLLKRGKDDVKSFTYAIDKMMENINYCSECNNISDAAICSICASVSRNKNLMCIVADFRDVIAIESTSQFNGLYHVLGGLISPIDGIGPSDLNFHNINERIQQNEVKEILLALSATVEGDTTNFYIYRKLKDLPIEISTIAKGISIGEDLEFADELTLSKSIINRIPFENTLSIK